MHHWFPSEVYNNTNHMILLLFVLHLHVVATVGVQVQAKFMLDFNLFQ